MLEKVASDVFSCSLMPTDFLVPFTLTITPMPVKYLIALIQNLPIIEPQPKRHKAVFIFGAVY